MEATLDRVPLRLKPVLSLLLAACHEDGRIRSVWLEGSLARGLADDWSDIDLHLMVRDPEAFAPIEWLDSQVHLVLADAIPGLPGGFICLTSEWIHIDLNVHSMDDELPDSVTRRVLLDHDALIQDSPDALRPPGQTFFPAQDVRIFMYFLGKTVASVHRGDLIALSQATAMMRDRLLINLLLAENGIRSAAVTKRIGEHLSDEQMQCLRRIPAFELDELSLREAQEIIAAAYLTRARKLCKESQADWPLELERATKQLLLRELNMTLCSS